MRRALLLLLVVVSALAVVWTRHSSRSHFAQLQELQQRSDELSVEWGRLQIEQATWAEGHRVEVKATGELGLVKKRPEDVVVIVP
ncbi:MAG: cell division protein FtsL [Pseudomonadota bacterium]